MTTIDIKRHFVSVTEAARIIGVTVGRVRQLLISKEMRGQKLSKDDAGDDAGVWIIERKEAEKFSAKSHKIGRPRSSKNSA